LRLTYQLKKLKEPLKDQPSAMAMIDMALHDILGKNANMPLYLLLGGFRERIKTSITIGIEPLPETLSKAKDFFDKGFKVIKLKGGSNVEEDIEKIRKLREMLGSSLEIRFDANQGYTVEESIHFVKETRKAKVEIFEQPTPKGQPEKTQKSYNSGTNSCYGR
jgi:L-alanine-DL-glutamate epimerase-like enolase superfamily enzyme